VRPRIQETTKPSPNTRAPSNAVQMMAIVMETSRLSGSYLSTRYFFKNSNTVYLGFEGFPKLSGLSATMARRDQWHISVSGFGYFILPFPQHPKSRKQIIKAWH